MNNLIHALQLEAAFCWFHENASEEASDRLNTRTKWFDAMKRINSTICERAIEIP